MNEIGNVILVEQKPISIKTTSDLGSFVYHVIKRTFDIIVSLIACLLLLPITIVIKIITLLSGDTHSIFYSQERIGKDGKIFKIYKFRSMVPNADKLLEKTLEMDKVAADEWKKYQKLSNDPRITKIGRIIRKTSIDELPQFLNVLKGDMSMIGPRPLVNGELDSFSGNHEIYESVKPGITGWWACNGRSATTYTDRLNLEYYYVINQSLSLDIKCIFKTIAEVFSGKGAK